MKYTAKNIVYQSTEAELQKNRSIVNGPSNTHEILPDFCFLRTLFGNKYDLKTWVKLKKT